MPQSTAAEDLFVFTMRQLSMKKGERLVTRVVETLIPYADVFTLDLPFAPPPEVRSNLNSEQLAEVARLLVAPSVLHKVRLTNKSAYPLTTAPALVVKDTRVLAQGMTTFTAINATSDVDVTKAVDIQVAKSDAETGRVPTAVRWQGSEYARVDLAGTIKLTNHRDKAVDIEVTRRVLGNVTAADNGGVVAQVNTVEDSSLAGDLPPWWRWYSWPAWWGHFNGVGRITWKVRIEPGKSVDLGYTWHYFWR
jgi:hypothetical protein